MTADVPNYPTRQPLDCRHTISSHSSSAAVLVPHIRSESTMKFEHSDRASGAALIKGRSQNM